MAFVYDDMLAILANVYTSSHFFVDDGVVRHDTIVILGCNHAEADTRITPRS